MSEQLTGIPLGVEIVDKEGTPTLFFRLLWDKLIALVAQVQTVAAVELLGKTAAIVTVAAFTVINTGNYRISIATQKTVADGVASSLTVTVSWTSRGIPMSHTFAALATDTIGANDSVTWLLNADANSDVTYAIAYASTTPAKMVYNANVLVEKLA